MEVEKITHNLGKKRGKGQCSGEGISITLPDADMARNFSSGSNPGLTGKHKWEKYIKLDEY